MKKPSSKSSAKKHAPQGSPRAAKKQPAAPRPLPRAPGARAEKAKPASDAGPVSPSELSSDVMEFINAIDKYKRLNRRPFPSWSEIFEIVKALGYHKSA